MFIKIKITLPQLIDPRLDPYLFSFSLSFPFWFSFFSFWRFSLSYPYLVPQPIQKFKSEYFLQNFDANLLLTIFRRSNSSRIKLSTCLRISSSTSFLLTSLIISSSYLCSLLWLSSLLFHSSAKVQAEILNVTN